MTILFILLILMFTAFACALVGNFLVLRRMALIGDAISHSVLPGIVIAFLIVGTLDSPMFFLLAVGFALLMTFFVQLVTDNVKISEESVIGIVFTFLFSLGVVLLVQYANNVHLDQDAVLFGQVEFAPFQHLIWNGVSVGPRALWTMGLVFVVNLLFVGLLFKEMKVAAFDAGFAKSIGVKVRRMHYLLMFLTAVTVVAAFEVTGPILVVALLVVPSLCASLFARSLKGMMFFSFLFGALACVLGVLLAFGLDVSVSGSVAVMAGVILFVLVFAKNLWQRYNRQQSLTK